MKLAKPTHALHLAAVGLVQDRLNGWMDGELVTQQWWGHMDEPTKSKGLSNSEH